MSNTAVLGLQWGDEGKGKIIDEFAPEADIVVRLEGGANAGHTVVADGKKVINHQLSSGALAGKICAHGRGLRLEPGPFLAEIRQLQAAGFALPEIWVDGGAFLVTQWHKALEYWVEYAKGSRKAYTTMRGMCGIAALIALRGAVKVEALYHPDELQNGLADAYQMLAPIFGQPLFQQDDFVRACGSLKEPETLAEELLAFAADFEPYRCDVRQKLYEAWRAGRPILFEGAQGTMLDAYWGTYGFNTQGLCTFAGLAHSAGLPAEALGQRVGVVKAILTRVGNGPFPAELGEYAVTQQEKKMEPPHLQLWLNETCRKINAGYATDQEVGRYLRVTADEYGATSGRPRRTGWQDLALLRYVIQINRPEALALTKLDCLSGLSRLKVVVGYRLDGRELPAGVIPALSSEYARVEPIYEEIDGWEGDITGERSFRKLPRGAQRYVEIIEKEVGCPITLIGTGPAREDRIIRLTA